MDALTKLQTKLNPIQEAELVSSLVKEGNSQSYIGKAVGRDQTWVAKRLALLNLSPKLRRAVEAGRLSASVAYEIAVLDVDAQKRYEGEDLQKLRVVDVRPSVGHGAITHECGAVFRMVKGAAKNCPACGKEIEA